VISSSTKGGTRGSDGTECEVREAYTDPEGLIEHNANILEARTRLFKGMRWMLKLTGGLPA